MHRRKRDAADLRQRHTIFVQLGLVASLLLLIGLFTVSFQVQSAPPPPLADNDVMVPIDLPATRHADRPPPPAPSPLPPIEVPDDLPDEAPLPDLFEEFEPAQPLVPVGPPRPPEPRIEEAEPPTDDVFERVEEDAEPIGGIEGIQQRARYPEMARRAGIEGTAFVQFVVNEDGSVQDLVCVRDPGGGTCESAIEAIRQTRFNPGRQRGRAVRVRMSLPVRFRLR